MKISEFQKHIKDLYFERDVKRGKEKVFLWFVEEVGELSKALRRKDFENIKEEIADCFAWLFSLANVHNVDVEEILSKKYPEKCIYCNSNPCRCDKL